MLSMKTGGRVTRIWISILAFIMAVSLSGCAPKEIQLSLDFLGYDVYPDSEPILTSIPETNTPRSMDGRALISFAGDCTFSNMQGLTTFNSVYDSKGPAYFLGGVNDVFSKDDLTIVNLEGPFTTSTARIDKGEPEETDSDDREAYDPNSFWFKAPPEYVQILTSGSVEMCNLANNHIMDYGYDGFYETQRTLDSAGIDYFVWDDTFVKEVNGIKIGFFGFSFDPDAYNIQVAMDQLWDDGAEVIVAYFHDGIEGSYNPSDSQIAAAYAAIDYGASAVVMSHPHVIQGIEEYEGGFIAYSMGNFCYGGHTNPNDKDSMIVQLEFLRSYDGSISCTPYIIPCSITSTPGTNDYRPSVLSGAEAQRVLEKISAYSR